MFCEISQMKFLIRKLCIFSLSGLFLFVQYGCASHRTSAHQTPQLGKVGVVSAQYTPTVEFELPAKGWLGGAARGAVEGTKSFIVLVPTGGTLAGIGTLMAMGGPQGLLVGLVGVGLLLKGAGYMIIGPFYGAATAEVPATVEEAEAHLKAALISMRIQERMRDHVVHEGRVANFDITVVDGQGPESASDLLTYFPLQEPQLDSVLELRVTRVWLSSNESFFTPLTSMLSEEKASLLNPSQELQINPPLSLGMEVRVRLIRTADKVVLYDNTWKYEGESHLFTEWAANDAKLFAGEFERAYDELAGQLSSSIFR